jgi:formylglycine-generating enzyme required for sulfatase activity
VATAIAVMLAACSAPSSRYVEPRTGIVFALVPAGTFVMGSPPDEPGHQDEERAHRVRLTKPFYIATTEVTRQQWTRVMAPPPGSAADGNLPVVNVSWFDVNTFVDKLRAASGRRVRLPTEAEWEYACRAHTATAYATGATLSTDQANYNGRFPLPGQSAGLDRGALTPAGSFAPNQWGLHDMHGNAWEWTSDAPCDYPAGDAVNPVPNCAAELKVIRGGSWRFNADSARCAVRYTHRPQDRGDSLGFRVVMEVEQ